MKSNYLCGCGGTGRRAALRSLWEMIPWKFESSRPHQTFLKKKIPRKMTGAYKELNTTLGANYFKWWILGEMISLGISYMRYEIIAFECIKLLMCEDSLSAIKTWPLALKWHLPSLITVSLTESKTSVISQKTFADISVPSLKRSGYISLMIICARGLLSLSSSFLSDGVSVFLKNIG